MASGVLTARSVANGRDCVLQYDYTSPIRLTNGFNLPFLLLHAHVFFKKGLLYTGILLKNGMILKPTRYRHRARQQKQKESYRTSARRAT